MDGDTVRRLPSFAVVASVPDGALRRRRDRDVADVTGGAARELAFPVERLRPAPRPEP